MESCGLARTRDFNCRVLVILRATKRGPRSRAAAPPGRASPPTAAVPPPAIAADGTARAPRSASAPWRHRGDGRGGRRPRRSSHHAAAPLTGRCGARGAKAGWPSGRRRGGDARVDGAARRRARAAVPSSELHGSDRRRLCPNVLRTQYPRHAKSMSDACTRRARGVL